MLGRKREDLDRKRGGAPAKRRWQKEIDNENETDAENVTAEEIAQWRRREERRSRDAPTASSGSRSMPDVRRRDRREPSEDRRRERREPSEDRRQLPREKSVENNGREKEKSPDKAAQERAASSTGSPSPSPKRQKKRFAWMDSDEEDDGEDEGDEAEERPPQTGDSDRLATGIRANSGDTSGASASLLASEELRLKTAASATPGPDDSAGGAAEGLMQQTQSQLQLQMQQQVPQQQQPPQMHTAAASSRGRWTEPDEPRFIGRIKRFTELPNGGGYGFISSEEAKVRFARDVYVHKNQMQGFGIGDEVCFTGTKLVLRLSRITKASRRHAMS